MKNSNYTSDELADIDRRREWVESLGLSNWDAYVALSGSEVCLDGYFSKEDLMKIIAAMEAANGCS